MAIVPRVLAKNLLRRSGFSIGEIAERVGYSSQSTFTVAFTRLVGLPPTRFVREQIKPDLGRRA